MALQIEINGSSNAVDRAKLALFRAADKVVVNSTVVKDTNRKNKDTPAVVITVTEVEDVG